MRAESSYVVLWNVAVHPTEFNKCSSQSSIMGFIVCLFIYDLIVTLLLIKANGKGPSLRLMTRLTFNLPTAYEASGRVLKKYTILLVKLSFKRNMFLGVIILV